MMLAMETFQYEIGLRLYSIFFHRFHLTPCCGWPIGHGISKGINDILNKPKAQAQLQTYI
jgi:hypothetical protein